MEAEDKFHVTLHAAPLPMTGAMHSRIFLCPQEYSKSMLQRHVATKPPYLQYEICPQQFSITILTFG